MRIFTIALMLIPLVVANANGATARARVAASASPTTATTRAPATTGRVAARAATPATPAPAQKTVAARAAVAQKVVNNGTKIAGATQNTAVDSVCQQKFDGCMDSFCMLDNTNGGRCMCSDRGAELDAAMAEIEKLDEKSYQMATVGLDRIEMGDDADAAIANADAVADAIMNQESKTPNVARRTLDLSAWDTTLDFDDLADSIFASEESIQTQTGDALQRAAADLCAAQIPECEKDIRMLQMVYSQKVRSDCNAYENSIKQQKNASTQKLATAQRAMREAALEQLRTANKYDLGQCTTEFKKCMINTGGCGDDFSKCAAVAAFDSTNIGRSTSKKAKNYFIKGAATTIEINASTYDTLLAKQPLCMNVTKSCVAVRDQVWDTFLREVAPQLKSAELIAEDNVRQNCIGNISACFQKACKDTMDPNDPEGSYDMCLSRPENMLNVCKVPLNACGVDATSISAAEKSNIWDYVLARLASIRVNACNTEVKDCVVKNCGSDYSKCVGFDIDNIINMCPTDLLTGCHDMYGKSGSVQSDDVYEYVWNVIQGLILAIDDSQLTACQNALDESMVRICGDTESCSSMTVANGVGARSLTYKICTLGPGHQINMNDCVDDISQISDEELGRYDTVTIRHIDASDKETWPKDTETRSTMGNDKTNYNKTLAVVIAGEIDWNNVKFDEDGNMDIQNSVADMTWLNPKKASFLSEKFLTDEKNLISRELGALKQNVNSTIDTIESDTTVQWCTTGREIAGMSRRDGSQNVTPTARSMVGNGRFPKLTVQMRRMIGNEALKLARDNYNAKLDELKTKRAKDYADLGTRIAEIRKQNAMDVRRDYSRIACLNMAGGSALAPAVRKTANNNGDTQDADAKTIGKEYQQESAELTASKKISNATYEETVTATFEWTTLNCKICTRKMTCAEAKRKFCKTWSEPSETCYDVQF